MNCLECFGNETIADLQDSDVWAPIDALVVGDVVRVEKMTVTADETLQIKLTGGTTGVVVKVDEEGDVQIRFPSLDGLRCCIRWVLSADFGKLPVRRGVVMKQPGIS